MKSIQVNAKFVNIPGVNLAAFKKEAAEALAIAQREQGVLQYDWFFDDGEKVCIVLETYRDSEALLAHIANVGEPFGRLVELVGRCELAIFGDPSARVVDATKGLQPSVFPSCFQRK